MKPSLFNLYVRKTDVPERFLVSADDPQGPSQTVSFAPDDTFKTNLLKLHARGSDRVLHDIPSQDVVTSQLGEELFRTFIKDVNSNPISDAYEAFFSRHDPQSPQRIALHLPRSLYRLPWELLRDPQNPKGDFLSLFHSLVRIDGELPGPDPRSVRIPPSGACLQMLFVLSSPSNRPISDFTIGSTPKVKFLRVKPPEYRKFLDFAFKADVRPDGFIFFGHGDIKQQDGALVFIRRQGLAVKRPEADLVPGYTVGWDLNRSPLRFGFVLACETAWVGDEFPFGRSVVGAILERSRIPFVLGAQTPISLYAAQEFLSGMIESLQCGTPLDLAITEGRRVVYGARPDVNTYTALDWWVPVIYSRTTSFNVIADQAPLEIPLGTRKF